jgi:hypothetical protein
MCVCASNLTRLLRLGKVSNHEQTPVAFRPVPFRRLGPGRPGRIRLRLRGSLAVAGIGSHCKTQPPSAPAGRFAKDQFEIDLERDTVSCPNRQTTAIRRGKNGDGIAYFGSACNDCPLREQCTTSHEGRTIAVGRYEQRLADARRQQQDPAWVADYRATRPKIERKLGHLMRRKHGGRRARMRGTTKIDADFNLLAAAHNLARLAVLEIRSTTTGWTVATA